MVVPIDNQFMPDVTYFFGAMPNCFILSVNNNPGVVDNTIIVNQA